MHHIGNYLVYARKLTVTGFPVYGSSRLGEKQANKLVYNTSFTISGVDGEGTLLPDSVILSETELIDVASTPLSMQAPATQRKLGKKLYELSNHTSTPLSTGLGNVLATIFDRRVHTVVSSDTLWDGDIASAQDYYPFGMIIPDRNYVATGGKYRYGFNGMEKDEEMYGSGNSYDFGARIYDSRLGRFLSVDPLFRKYAGRNPYVISNNDPVLFIDNDGLDGVIYIQVMLDQEGKPLISSTNMNDVVERLKNKYAELGVDLAVEVHYSNDIMSKEEFNSREGFHESDNYVIMGTVNQLVELEAKTEDLGWEHMSYGKKGPEGVNGISNRSDNHVTCTVENLVKNGLDETYSSTVEKISTVIQHETGHRKFKDHPGNRGDEYYRTGPGVMGHVGGTIMDRQPSGEGDLYDYFMISKLREIHGETSDARWIIEDTPENKATVKYVNHYPKPIQFVTPTQD